MRGKFLFVGDDKLYVRGATYGPFRPQPDGGQYHTPEVARRDFATMAAHGINAVRTYTVPAAWVLDAAQQHGLRVMVGIPWEQHIAFLDDRQRERDIERRVREAVRACAGHPAMLCHAIGNEIPASLVRWYGPRRVERFLERLYRAAKEEDPGGLVTYVNYPSTEYLHLDFLDFASFNVYLESQERLAAYLARLQNLAGERPLLMAEIGMDSRRHGRSAQAQTLAWQVRSLFAGGCAGCFVFSWTDEWHRGSYEIEDWDFGLTDRQRRPKPALRAVSDSFAAVPFPADQTWPHVTVAVCTYNGSRTIRDTLGHLQRLSYPAYDVIVVDDGSTDGVADVARQYDVRVIRTPNQGLSCARNTALAAAAGEVIAYIDDDAYPDPHWLTYLTAVLLQGCHAGAGGPNIAPMGDGPVAECVANAPGGPIHVLLSDGVAEHIPGCNMAFWRQALTAVGGFDPRFRTAGDDVDICWRLQERGWTLGFAPGAVVWHHRRNQVGTYWRQQKGYGRAEALLEEKWPHRYNGAGHLTWSGRLYGRGLVRLLSSRRQRIYHGTWGSALFQSLYHPAPGLLSTLPAMPEWYLLIAGLTALAGLSLLWQPLLLAVPPLVAALLISLLQAVLSARRASFPHAPARRAARLERWGLTTLLYLAQPLARLHGRLAHGLTPWRRRGNGSFAVPGLRQTAVWSESWRPSEQWLAALGASFARQGTVFRPGGDFDRWDLEVRVGMGGSARLRMAIEEHGGGRQLARFRAWPRPGRVPLLAVTVLVLLAEGARDAQAWTAAVLLGGTALLTAARILRDCGAALASCLGACEQLRAGDAATTR
ncbi:MAG: glycosyltransferase [Candidatus Latescibacterota bacterium]